VKGKGQNRKK